jgi:AcrR family transcriptional regulator
MDDVKRPYDATSRQQQARVRRLRVVLAARDLFERDGYRRTTVVGIAAAAEVSPEMVYKTFGSKAALAKAVFDVALAGDDEPVPIRERPAIAAIRAEPDVRRQIALFVEGLVQRLGRSARIQVMVRDGRHVDESLQPVWDQLVEEGLTGMRMLGRRLLDTGQLRAGLDLDEVTDLLWNYLAIDHYERLVLTQGWTRQRYQAWLTRTIIDALC